MKFSAVAFALFALSASAVNALALPAAAVVEERRIESGILKPHRPRALADFSFDADDIPDAAVADLDLTPDDDDDDVSPLTPTELAQLASIRAIPDPDVDSLTPRDLEERGIKGLILKLLLKKTKKSKLGKMVWNKLPKAQRKRIVKYVKKAGKDSKKAKSFLRKEVKPVVISVLAGIIGTGAAKVVANDVVPWVVDVIMAIVF